MVDFLLKHFRYHTMNGWNQSTSYAANIKIYNLGLTKEIRDKMYDMLDTDGFWDEIRWPLDAFAREYNHRWQIGTNGRSGGYLVLYQGYTEPSEHKSYCSTCGQRNFRSVTETGNQCGKCHEHTRVDYKNPPMRIGTYPGKSLDMHEDFEDFSMDDLRERVKLVQHFDKVCDEILANAIQVCEDYTVEDETYFVPQTRRILVAAAG